MLNIKILFWTECFASKWYINFWKLFLMINWCCERWLCTVLSFGKYIGVKIHEDLTMFSSSCSLRARIFPTWAAISRIKLKKASELPHRDREWGPHRPTGRDWPHQPPPSLMVKTREIATSLELKRFFPESMTNGNHIVNSALTDLDMNSRQLLSPNKSTLVIHSVQRVSGFPQKGFVFSVLFC